MAEAPQNGRTGDESTEYRPHETTVHYGPEFAAQLAAMEAIAAAVASVWFEALARIRSRCAAIVFAGATSCAVALWLQRQHRQARRKKARCNI